MSILKSLIIITLYSFSNLNSLETVLVAETMKLSKNKPEHIDRRAPKQIITNRELTFNKEDGFYYTTPVKDHRGVCYYYKYSQQEELELFGKYWLIDNKCESNYKQYVLFINPLQEIGLHDEPEMPLEIYNTWRDLKDLKGAFFDLNNVIIGNHTDKVKLKTIKSFTENSEITNLVRIVPDRKNVYEIDLFIDNGETYIVTFRQMPNSNKVIILSITNVVF